MAITTLKRGQTYFYVDSWTSVPCEFGVMAPREVVVIEAVTGGSKAPKVKYSGSSRHFQLFFDSPYTTNAVWATREEAEAAKLVCRAARKLHEA